jgi:PPK2 family polyphosphate:nucleotide phosphotransferase
MPYAQKLTEPSKLDIKDFDSSATKGLTEEAAREEAMRLGMELGELQETLYAASMHSVLIVLQGMDTSGKDGTISHVFSAVNPQGVSVASFKQPTELEKAHDFLWRVHQKVPQRSNMTIFNRSHYEDVLAVRVHDLVPEKVWKHRYDQINAFEKELAASDTIVVKFFLNISKHEQKKRLEAREADVTKGWKLSPGDWHERQYWDDYIAAYEDVLRKTAAEDAPWYVVPADHKWFRNVAVAEALVETLRPHKKAWEERLKEISTNARAELAKMRAEKDGGSKAPQRPVVGGKKN